VGEVLSELGVSLLGADFCTPPPSVEVRDGLQVQVVRVTEETIIEQNEIPYETVWVPDPELELDQRRLDDAGANGMQRRRYKAVYHDGQENDRFLEAEWVAVPPRERQIVYGTRIVVRTAETPHGPIEYWRRIRVFRTAYTEATCGKTTDDPLYGITRLGWRMRHGIIAVDPRVIRLRSNLYVPDYGPGIAGDTGSLIKGRHIDLGYDVGGLIWHYEWGYVYVLTPVPPAREISWILPDYPRER
jgi:3D (Asp-Asp-Asp) domain-containing protein